MASCQQCCDDFDKGSTRNRPGAAVYERQILASEFELLCIIRFHTKRLREVYRSAGWPFQDTVEIELIAAGLLDRTSEPSGHDKC